MDAAEKAFVKRLLESGRISFKDAGRLEDLREQNLAVGKKSAVWDLAVAEGLVDAKQAEEIRRSCTPATASKSIDNTDTTGNLAPVEGAAQAKGRTLGGFTLLSKIGKGGMGVVYKARQESMDRVVALKVLPRNLAQDKSFIERFLREARAAGKLGHPNIVAGIDAGFADGYYYFAMEYVQGRNLADRLRDYGPLKEPEAVALCIQVCEALTHAHAAGLVHRDIKPENVLVTRTGQAKLCDLGLARATGADDMQVTMAGAAVGTPYYASPEQVRGLDPDFRSDLYSLGCTLYHLISGSPPFQGSNPMAVMQMHITNEAQPLADVVHGVSRALSAVVAMMMAKEPADRYQTAAALLVDLRRLAEGGIPSALSRDIVHRRRAGDVEGSDLQGTGPRRLGTVATQPTAPRRNRTTGETMPMRPPASRLPVKLLLAAAGGLVLIAAAVVAVIILVRPSSDDTDDATGDEPVVEQPPAKTPDQLRLERLAKSYDDNLKLGEENIALNIMASTWEQFVADAAGTEWQQRGQEKLAAIRKQQADADEARRLADFTARLEELKLHAERNPEDYVALIAGYERLAKEAAGTPAEAQAISGADLTRRARTERARAALASIRRAVEGACAKNDFGTALADISRFPDNLAPEVRADLTRMEESVRASGRRAWEELLASAMKLAGAKKFDEAARVISSAKSFGLPALDRDRAAALADVEKLRSEAQATAIADQRHRYDKFRQDWRELAAADAFADIVTAGNALKGKLPPDLEASLAADLEIAAGAADMLTSLRGHLEAAQAGAFMTRLPLGEKQGRFRGYDKAADTVDFEFFPGSTTLRLSQFRGELMLQLFRRSAGARLTSQDARLAICYCLARGETTEVEPLFKKCRDEGLDVTLLEQRLAALTSSGGGQEQ